MSQQEIRSHRDLRVWQVAMDLAVECYELTRPFPAEERFGLTSQIRRAAAGVAANIAEGYGRDNRGDYVHHLRIAQGSLKEIETHIELAVRVSIVAHTAIDRAIRLCDELGKMLRSLIRSLQDLPANRANRR